MGILSRSISIAGARRVIVALGGIYISLAVGYEIFIAAGDPFGAILADSVLLVVPGLALLYGGYRLPQTDIHPDAYPLIALWCLRGIAVMAGVIIVLELNPAGSVDRTFYTPVIATALGSIGGFGVGVNEARAITRAYEAEERNRKLQRERNLRERIVETSPVGIVVIDADGTLSFANDHAVEMLGLPRDEIVGLEYDTSMFEATDADGNPIEEGVFDRVLSSGEPVFDAERHLTRSDGRRIWLLVSGAPLREPSGDVSGVVFTAEDITERKRWEQRLERQNKRLESFASMLAHELRNPLTIAQIYHRQAANGDEQAADEVETALARIEEMIDVLLVTARGAESVIDREDVPLPDAAKDAWTDVSRDGAELVVETERTVRSDPVHLHHLLTNLFQNSVEHGEGAVTVRVGNLQDADGFYVEDDGPGIPEGEHEAVFEAGHTTDSDGIGLGLTFVEQLAETYGWDCTLTKSEAGGTRFEFTGLDSVPAE